jgi:hypothetical protein
MVGEYQNSTGRTASGLVLATEILEPLASPKISAGPGGDSPLPGHPQNRRNTILRLWNLIVFAHLDSYNSGLEIAAFHMAASN